MIIDGTFPVLTRIGQHAFTFAGDAKSTVILAGLSALASIEVGAFLDFKGTLILRGSFPNLVAIRNSAFYNMQSIRSAVELTGGLTQLAAIGSDAFNNFKGTVVISGEFPLLSDIGKYAFYRADNVNSTVELRAGLPALATFDEYVFAAFGGTLDVMGDFPRLSRINDSAFFGTGNALSNIAIACSSPSGLNVSNTAFAGFKGAHDASTQLCACGSGPGPCTTRPPAALTTTTTTTTTATTTKVEDSITVYIVFAGSGVLLGLAFIYCRLRCDGRYGDRRKGRYATLVNVREMNPIDEIPGDDGTEGETEDVDLVDAIAEGDDGAEGEREECAEIESRCTVEKNNNAVNAKQRKTNESSL